MTKTIDVIYEKGVFKPLKKVKLPEQSRFKITVLYADDKESVPMAKKQSKMLLALAGSWASGDRDISENTDKYLYGKSRK